MHTVHDTDTDLSSDADFQKLFNGFYNVRKGDIWRKEYYSLFHSVKNSTPSFQYIITELKNRVGTVEASFSSKMLATINPTMPIWDSRVLESLGLTKDWNKEHSINNAMSIYNNICDWYSDYLKSSEAEANVFVFDAWFPEYKDISDVKKIDYLLWCEG